MFRDEITGKLSRRGDPRTGEWMVVDEVGNTIKSGESVHAPEKEHRIVVEKRDRIYMRRVFNEEKRVYEDVEVGRGFEIVREIRCTEEGERLWNSWTPEQRGMWVDATRGAKPQFNVHDGDERL